MASLHFQETLFRPGMKRRQDQLQQEAVCRQAAHARDTDLLLESKGMESKTGENKGHFLGVLYCQM